MYRDNELRVRVVHERAPASGYLNLFLWNNSFGSGSVSRVTILLLLLLLCCQPFLSVANRDRKRTYVARLAESFVDDTVPLLTCE